MNVENPGTLCRNAHHSIKAKRNPNPQKNSQNKKRVYVLGIPQVKHQVLIVQKLK
jgi:hypothetical protein